MKQTILAIVSAVTIDFSPLPNSDAKGDIAQDRLPDILQLVFAILGSIAFLILVISGLRYVLASGDPNRMSQAKQAILYAIIGLAVALSAFSIVTFVVKGTA